MAHKQLVEVCNFIDTAKTINAPICDGVLGNVPVDSVVGSYLLNPSKFHTETVYDTQNAAIGGTITYTYTAPRNVALDLNAVTVTNDGLFGFWTDFGDGYNDFGNVPDHTYNADGAYEIKTYVILNSRNKILINAKEVTILSGIITYAPTGNTSTISRPYKHSINAALQNYCDITPQGSAYLANGSTYTPIGTLSLLREVIIDELEDNGDYQAIVATPTVQRRHENFVVTGTTPLVIPAGAISISVTKTNNTGVVNISGDNGTNFPLTFNRENFTDSVNEGYSTLSAYTITGTLAGTTYKVHIIR